MENRAFPVRTSFASVTTADGHRLPANEIAATDDPGGRARDHRRVVGAIRKPWIGDRHVRPC